LPDGLVDALLDAAASGVNTVERDGVSHRHEASFVLIGTMNPEEGELRPQLTDRFGLMVALQNCFDPLMRQRIVKARLAFDADPVAFRAACAAQQEDCAQRIRAARERFGSLAFDDTVHARVSALCIAAHVDGMRADLVMLRAARALAALEGAQAVSVAHVERVAEAVLLHRRRDEASSSIGVPEQHAHDSAVAPPTGEPAAAPAAASGSPLAATLGTAPAATFGTTPGITPAATPGTASGAAPGTLPAAPAGDSDWGYLAPEPTGTRSVKGVIPLALKKR
jgi:magnesium chelatase subunit I